jgi:hypothetical protein
MVFAHWLDYKLKNKTFPNFNRIIILKATKRVRREHLVFKLKVKTELTDSFLFKM